MAVKKKNEYEIAAKKREAERVEKVEALEKVLTPEQMQAILSAAQAIQEFVCDYTECEDFELSDARILPRLAKAKSSLEDQFSMTGGWGYQLPMFRKGGE